jgi:hypothetical protein
MCLLINQVPLNLIFNTIKGPMDVSNKVSTSAEKSICLNLHGSVFSIFAESSGFPRSYYSLPQIILYAVSA